MIEVYKHNEKAIIPTRAHPTDAGWDLYALEDIHIPVGATKSIDTGIAINVPECYVGRVEDRSSLAAKGLRTGGGIVDAGYSGSIKVVLHNFSDSSASTMEQHLGYFTTSLGAEIKAGDKIAQLVIYPIDTEGIMETRWLWTSARDKAGFGSTGS